MFVYVYQINFGDIEQFQVCGIISLLQILYDFVKKMQNCCSLLGYNNQQYILEII